MRTPPSEHVTLVEVLELTRPSRSSRLPLRPQPDDSKPGRDQGTRNPSVLRRSGIDGGGIDPHLHRPQPHDGAHRHDHAMGRVREVLCHREADRRAGVRRTQRRSARMWVGQFGVVSKTFEEHVTGFVR